ncbi:MAG: hypothetical protein HOI49_07290 [Bacteroidetes bacterium]|jgi:hypothetical protein|nr:hypothetical protein [Bacteroidota bacterium]
MKKILSIICLMIGTLAASGQAQEVVIEIGDTIYFDEYKGDNYTYIDYYKKTRFETDKPLSDTATGWNFYNTFFNTGDFDVHRMSSTMKGKYGILKHIMAVQLEGGGTQMVFIAEVDKGKSAAYIVEPAFLTGEIVWSPAPR